VKLITTGINEYKGINLHLDRQLQSHDLEQFHMFHIAALHAELSNALEETGYTVEPVPSLQLRDLDEDTGNWWSPCRLKLGLMIRGRRTPGPPQREYLSRPKVAPFEWKCRRP